MAKIKPRPPQPSPLRLDWRAYFHQFMRDHGGHPVEHRGVLLFRDGWTYSATDWAGPWWPPPEGRSDLLALRRAYWTRRLKACEQRRELSQRRLENWSKLQSLTRTPLQVRVPVFDADGLPTGRTQAVDLNFADLEAELRELTRDVAECWQELNLIEREAA